MPKRRKSSAPPWPRVFLGLAVAALALFLVGEAWHLAREDRGRLLLARFGLGDPARATQALGGQLQRGLEAARVPRDSVRERVSADGAADVHWRVGLPPGTSSLQVNHALTQAVERAGGRVFSGRESSGPRGESRVTLVFGVGDRPTHEVVLARGPRADPQGPPAAGAGRIALVLYGFEDDEAAREFGALPVPFAMAVVAGAKSSEAQFKAAHLREREVVLHLPLEPINYPNVNPGPGTILVTLRPAQVAQKVRRYLDQAEPLVAVSNHMGSLATQDMELMTAVYRELKRAQMPFVHVKPVPGAVCRTLASDLGVAYDEPDAVLDGESRALDERWGELLERARDGRDLMVWVRATPLTRPWLGRIAEPKRLGGVSLVPLTAVLRRPVAS